MHFDLALIKEHPYATGAAVIVGGTVLYLLTRGGGSSATAASATDANGTPIAVLQLQAAQDQQNAQLNAQTQAAQLQAGVASQQIDANLQATAITTAAQLQAIQIQATAATTKDATDSATQIALAKQSADVLTTQLSTQAQVLTDQINAGVTEHLSDNATALGAISSSYDYQNHVADLQATLASQQISGQIELSKEGLGIVAKTGLNHEGSKESAILEAFAAALNQPAIGVAAANAQGVANVGTGTNSSAMIGAILNGGSKILTGLFAS